MRKKSKITVYTDLIMLIILFFTFLCAIISHKYTLLSKFIFLKVFDNYYTFPITNIEGSRWRCKSNFTYLFEYNYTGHKYGCFDNNTKILLTNITQEDCTSSYPKGVYIEGIDKTPMNAWKSKVICFKRENYKDKYKIVKQTENCPESYKFCGFSNNFNDRYCVKNEYKCPIFYFNITSTNDPDKKNEELFSYVDLDEKYSLIYSNNHENPYVNNSFIKVDFQIGEDYPCINKNLLTYKNKLFPFLNDKERYGCYKNNSMVNRKDPPKHIDRENYNKTLNFGIEYEQYLDKRFTEIDKVKVFRFNIENDLKYLNDLPQIDTWKVNKTINYNLYSRPYVSPNFTCLNSNITRYTDLDNFYNDVKIYNYILICLLLGNFIFLCFFISILSLMKITSRNQSLLLSFLKNIQNGGFFYFSVLYIFKINEKNDYFNESFTFLSDEHCLDETSRFGFTQIFEIEKYLEYRKHNIDVIFYSGIPYFICMILQVFKFFNKIYLRIRNKERNIQAKNIFQKIDNLTEKLNQ